QNVSSDTVCDGQAIANVTGGTSPFAYLWDDNNVQTTQTAVGLCMGTYNVIVTDGNGCTSTSYVFVDSIVMGINKLVLIQPLKIYPNPFTTSTTIAFGNANAEPYLLLVYNMLGNTVRAIPGITESKVVIDRENLPSGVYFVYLQGKAKTFRGRMIVE
ncbi:MAG TPA: T9SS type A sorting domain-containing protein, partial [Flavobacteriales bacterium]|nr:T9SS type A sorting domain-containing protein [Flavobacteriales bacterium]